jgi:C4-dicarboxylate-specific signal transduction histidine kinase
MSRPQQDATIRPALERHGLHEHLCSIDENGLPQVRGDHVQLQQVALNLTLDAAEAMAGLPFEKAALASETLHDDHGMVVRVRDMGGGVEVENPEQIFAPFFTAKAQGTGVGLSIGRSIIGSLGRRLWGAIQNAGAGTTFRCWLPVPSGIRAALGNVATSEAGLRHGNRAG